MRGGNAPAVGNPAARPPKEQRFPEEFKRAAVRLVTHERYTFRAAAAAVHVSQKSVRDWHARLAPQPATCGPGATHRQLHDEITRLKRQLRRAHLERDILAASHGVLDAAVALKYAWIALHCHVFPVTVMCRVLRVSASGYFGSRARPAGVRSQRHELICQAVRQVHAESHGVYGSVKIARALKQRPQLAAACRNTVARAMREMGLTSRVRGNFQPTTTQANPAQPPAANTLAGNFTAAAANRKWVADITYLPTAEGWVFLAVVLDLFSRKVVGWAIGASLATELASLALGRAIAARHPSPGTLLHHSDRGCQYTSSAYQQELRAAGIACSMSRAGCCYDNAAMERFFWSLKHEWTNHASYANLEETRLGVFQYIETFYNTERLHQTLNYVSPNQFEATHPPTLQADPPPSGNPPALG